METVALRSWIIRQVTEEAVAMEEVVNGEPTGEVGEFGRQLLPDDLRPGDRFRVVAQLERVNSEPGESFPSPALAEAAEALAGMKARDDGRGPTP